MLEITRYGLYDILRNRIVIAYTVLLFCVSLGLFMLENQPEKAVLSLLNVILLFIPLVSIIFSTIYFYNAYEFTELLVAQPVNRKTVLLSQYVSVSVSLMLAYLVGVAFPLFYFAPFEQSLVLTGTGLLLTLVFISLAFLGAVYSRDKAKGIGISLLLWFYFSLVYDGLVLFLLFSFSDYPLEKLMLVLSMLNPVDLGRIMVLMKLESAAIMGFSGAVFQDFLGKPLGNFVAVTVLLVWAVVPFLLTIRHFKKKDL